MDTVTYPDSRTVSFVHDNLIAMRVNVSSDPRLAAQFKIQYTPTIVLADGDGIEHYRSVGFLPPEEFIPAMLLGIGRSHFDNVRYEKAVATMDKLLGNYAHSKWTSDARELKRLALQKRGPA